MQIMNVKTIPASESYGLRERLETENMNRNWNYDINECPLDTKVELLSEYNPPVLPQKIYVGTITERDGIRYRGECLKGNPDWFYRSSIIAWRLLES